MHQAHLSLVLVGASLLSRGEEQAFPLALVGGGSRVYAAENDARVQSSLVTSQGAGTRRLHGTTELADGTCLREEATTDASGRLVRAEITVRPAEGAAPSRRVVLDAAHGEVELTTPSLRARWAVPTDLPWAWMPLTGTTGASVTTPLDATVALLAASGDRAVRLLDLVRLESFTVTSDQVVVVGDAPGAATVVLGDDYAEVEQGLPQRLHVTSLGLELASLESPDAVKKRADLECTRPARPITL